MTLLEHITESHDLLVIYPLLSKILLRKESKDTGQQKREKRRTLIRIEKNSTTAVSGPFKHWNAHNPKTNGHPRYFTLLMLWWGNPKKKKEKNQRVEREERWGHFPINHRFFFLSFFLFFIFFSLKEKKQSWSYCLFSFLDVHWEEEKGARNISHIVFLSSIKFNSSFSALMPTLFFSLFSGWMSKGKKE